MDLIGAGHYDLDIGRRLFIIISFLVILWYALNYFVNKVKSGEIKIPAFLKQKFPGLEALEQSSLSGPYQLNIIQRKILPDGSELMVLDVNGRHILLSKTLHQGTKYLTDLNN